MKAVNARNTQLEAHNIELVDRVDWLQTDFAKLENRVDWLDDELQCNERMIKTQAKEIIEQEDYYTHQL